MNMNTQGKQYLQHFPFWLVLLISAVHRQVLSFLTSLLGNSDRNLSDAAHTQAVSCTACRPRPRKFHFKILLNMLQIPAGNVQCITEKGKGVNGQDKTIGKYPSRAAVGLLEHVLCLVKEMGWIFVTEGR